MGLGLFADKALLLDYASKNLTIYSDVDDLRLKEGFQEFQYTLTDSGLLLQAKQDEKAFRMILDTGASVSMLWQERINTTELFNCTFLSPEFDASDCTVTSLEIRSLSNDPISIPVMLMDEDYSHLTDFDGLIGNTFISSRKVLIDFKNNKIYFSKSDVTVTK